MLALLLALSAPPFAYAGPLPAGAAVSIRDVNGPVRVHEGAGFAVRATRTAQRGDPGAVHVRVDRDARGAFVCVRYPGQYDVPCTSRAVVEQGRGEDVVVSFDVTVPAGTPVDAATVNGDVEAGGRAIRRAVTVNGAVRVRVAAPARGTVVAKTVNGAIDVAVPAPTGFTVSARTVVGAIAIPGIAAQQRVGPMSRASGTVGDGALRLDLATVNGAIGVRRG